jgi:hypothetical protein
LLRFRAEARMPKSRPVAGLGTEKKQEAGGRRQGFLTRVRMDQVPRTKGRCKAPFSAHAWGRSKCVGVDGSAADSGVSGWTAQPLIQVSVGLCFLQTRGGGAD